jgi:hypothetical protein
MTIHWWFAAVWPMALKLRAIATRRQVDSIPD